MHCSLRMITLDDLAAFDLQVWLGSGQLAAAALHCHPSRISRRCRVVVEQFELLSVRRCTYEGRTPDWHKLLRLERRVHQQHRFMTEKGLRLEAAPGLGIDLPCGWWMPAGRCEKRSFRWQEIRTLLDEAIIDAAWINNQLVVLPEFRDRAQVLALERRLRYSVSVVDSMANEV